MKVHLRHAVRSDASCWEALRCDLWPDGALDHGLQIAAFFAGKLEEPAAVLMAENGAGKIVAFAELSIRTDVAGVEGTRVGYVEGLYVIPEARHQGVARNLLEASRAWALGQNCAGLASDRAGRVVVDRGFPGLRSRDLTEFGKGSPE